ncbi:Alpha/beta-Hydrolases superfamily protein [Rhynchospora pubera]|uniref:Phospholipase A1 EG1, chloroplastic/mitochondrial n=2 Tax=Rhynchospora pubera TaxID=906938 RepID=A0AAV8FX57_9POAL|nr:Alpha/beta-Hydrolases superfamily protein [Rhynchospora pubera]
MASISMSSSSLTSHNNKHHSTRLHATATATAVAVPSNLSRQNLATSTSAPSISIRHITPTVKVRNQPKSALANMWREIQGASDWANLMEPLHPLLRAEIIRYGELVTACYKAFDLDPRSKRYLNCKFGKSRMMEETGLGHSGYTVTKYIYATPDIDMPTCCSRWIGYVAVTTDEKEIKRLGRRDIIVSFRGTVTSAEWVANFMSSLTPARFDPHNDRPDVKVESGFLSLYTSDDSSAKFTTGSCRNQLLSEIARLINKYKDEEISITLAGHSMGSSLATLLGYDLAELGLNRDASGRKIPITVYSFAGPRVGNLGFKERCEELGVKVLRVVNVNDPVTKLPGVFLNENFRSLGERFELPWSCSCYTHVGVELALNFFKMNNPACVHDLEAYLGLLKCPAQMAKIKTEGEDIFSKLKDFISKQGLDNAWRFEAAALQLGNLVQSLNI